MTDSELWSFQRKKIDEINSILLSLIDKTNITAELKKTIIKYKEISSEQKLKNIPVVLSKSLSIFLGVPNGTKMSEKIVMNKIIKYINEHNLCSEDESSDVITLLLPLKDQQITLDEKLIKLINVNSRSYIMNRITPVHTSNNCFKLKIPYSQIQRCIKNKFIDMRRQNPVKVYCKTNKIDEELERYSLMWGVSPDHIKKRAIKNYSTFLNSNVNWERVTCSSAGIEGWYKYAPKKYQKKAKKRLDKKKKIKQVVEQVNTQKTDTQETEQVDTQEVDTQETEQVIETEQVDTQETEQVDNKEKETDDAVLPSYSDSISEVSDHWMTIETDDINKCNLKLSIKRKDE